MNNKYEEKFDLCLDYVLSKIRDPWNHKFVSELITEAIFKFANNTNYKRQLEKELKTYVGD